MFNFLKLHSSRGGDAQRHVPFASIIHNTLLIVFVFVFVSFSSLVPSSAVGVDPVFLPISGSSFKTFNDSYNDLPASQKNIFQILLGSQVAEYAGLSDYTLSEFGSDAWEWLSNVGQRVLEVLPDFMVSYSPIYDNCLGIVDYSSQFSSLNDFKDTVLNSSSQYLVPYNSEFGFALNQLFANSGGLFNWQHSISDWSNLSFSSRPLSGAQYDVYASAVNNLVHPVLLYHSFSNQSDRANPVSDYPGDKYLFFNTSTGYAYLTDEYGNRSSSSDYRIAYTTSNGSTSSLTARAFFSQIYFSNDPRSYQELVNDYFTRTSGSYLFVLSDRAGGGEWFAVPLFNLFVKGVYVGSSWNDKTPIYNNTDLGFSSGSGLQYYNPVGDTNFDLKGLYNGIEQSQNDVDLNDLVLNNTYNPDGSHITLQDLQGMSFNVIPPESGIEVPSDVFSGFFAGGSGFVSYVWYMTKPLISFTRDLLDSLTFGPVDNFQASGPGYFILGVAGLGVIGGVIVKFLL